MRRKTPQNPDWADGPLHHRQRIRGPLHKRAWLPLPTLAVRGHIRPGCVLLHRPQTHSRMLNGTRRTQRKIPRALPNTPLVPVGRLSTCMQHESTHVPVLAQNYGRAEHSQVHIERTCSPSIYLVLRFATAAPAPWSQAVAGKCEGGSPGVPGNRSQWREATRQNAEASLVRRCRTPEQLSDSC